MPMNERTYKSDSWSKSRMAGSDSDGRSRRSLCSICLCSIVYRIELATMSSLWLLRQCVNSNRSGLSEHLRNVVEDVLGEHAAALCEDEVDEAVGGKFPRGDERLYLVAGVRPQARGSTGGLPRRGYELASIL